MLGLFMNIQSKLRRVTERICGPNALVTTDGYVIEKQKKRLERRLNTALPTDSEAIGGEDCSGEAVIQFWILSLFAYCSDPGADS